MEEVKARVDVSDAGSSADFTCTVNFELQVEYIFLVIRDDIIRRLFVMVKGRSYFFICVSLVSSGVQIRAALFTTGRKIEKYVTSNVSLPFPQLQLQS